MQELAIEEVVVVVVVVVVAALTSGACLVPLLSYHCRANMSLNLLYYSSATVTLPRIPLPGNEEVSQSVSQSVS